MTPAFKRPESVLVVIHAPGPEVLMLQRADDPDFWQSVTGSLEAGETPLQAAQRELREETGLSAPVIDLGTNSRFPIRRAWRHRYAPGVTENLEHRFHVQVPRGAGVTLDPGEHLAFRWVDVPTALQLATSATNRDTISALFGAGH